MKTLDQLVQDCLDHGIVETYDELPFLDSDNCRIEYPAALQTWCIVAIWAKHHEADLPRPCKVRDHPLGREAT
jgi:hypothetical protein